MHIYFNSRSEQCKRPFGAVSANDTVNLTVAINEGVFVEAFEVEFVKHGENPVYYRMRYEGKKNELHTFAVDIKITSAGIYYYRFIALTENGVFTLGKGKDNWATVDSCDYYQQTVTTDDYVTPDELKGGLIYHIFADRFALAGKPINPKYGVLKRWGEEVTISDEDGVFRANDFYGGNIDGIISKLDYLKSLGVSMIYLSPIFKSSSNHRYDTGDYMQIDEVIGDEAAFKRLIDKAGDMGIGIMLDGVFNHTGADSLYFNKYGRYNSIGAYQGIKSPFFDWYHFINFPDEYACWWGITVTPTVNKLMDSYRRFIMGDGGVIDKWSGYGIKGWRLDVVDELDKDFVTGLRNVIKAKSKDIAIIGEVWEDASTKVAYGSMRPYLLGRQLDGVMNYPFKSAIIDYVNGGDVCLFYDRIMTITENYPKQSLDCCMTLLGTHDTVRAINALSGVNMAGTSKTERLHYAMPDDVREQAKRKLIIASAIQYFLPGVPSLYYGDEIGMEGWEDPINRRCMAWDNIDKELLAHYRFLGKLRTDNKEAFAGVFEMSVENDILRIVRKSGKKILTLVINLTDNYRKININGIDLITEKNVKKPVIKAKSFRIIDGVGE